MKPAYTTDVIQTILREFDSAKVATFTEAEVRDASARLQGRGAMEWQNPVLLLAENEAHALITGQSSFVFDEQAELLRSPANRWLPPSTSSGNRVHLVITVVGSPTLFDHPLADLSRPVRPYHLTIPPPPPLQPRTDPESLSLGKKWFERSRQPWVALIA